MGAWFRLKASYDISGFSAQNQVILRALKKHGMVLADNGSSLFMSGAPDPGWNNSDLNALRSVPGSAFEAVDVSSLKVSSTSYAVAGGAAAPASATPATSATPAAPPLRPSSWCPTAASRRASPAGQRSNKRTTLARVCTVAHGGSCSAELGRTRTGDATLDDSPNTVTSTTAGATTPRRLGARAGRTHGDAARSASSSGTTVVRSSVVTLTGDGTWRQLTVTSGAASGGTSLSVEIVDVARRGHEGPGRRRVAQVRLARKAKPESPRE